jgi:hypothetical protein
MKRTSAVTVRPRARTRPANGPATPGTPARPESAIEAINAETSPPEFAPPSQVEIELQAYQIWESEGRPEGCALDHWSRAVQILELERRERLRQSLGAYC